MTIRQAACNCRQLRVTCEGEPVRVSACHCLECQRRTGSAFSVQARFNRDQVRTEGTATKYSRIAESGNRLTFNFCPVCGSTVYWESEAAPDLIAIAVGTFADPQFPPPGYSVWEKSHHSWAVITTEGPLEHSD
jgi:hypothetical protein